MNLPWRCTGFRNMFAELCHQLCLVGNMSALSIPSYKGRVMMWNMPSGMILLFWFSGGRSWYAWVLWRLGQGLESHLRGQLLLVCGGGETTVSVWVPCGGSCGEDSAIGGVLVCGCVGHQGQWTGGFCQKVCDCGGLECSQGYMNGCVLNGEAAL